MVDGVGTTRYTYTSAGRLETSDGPWDNETVNTFSKSEFAYDGKMRRRVRKEYEWQGGGWVHTDEVRYIYDGNLVIQERDDGNNATVTYTRGSDMIGTFEGPGGIGGLLARTAHQKGPDYHACYHADGTGNITALANQEAIIARYQYDPFGNLLAKSGFLADANLYRFSSKEFHSQSGLIYYLYRYYEPRLQRWVNRDPIVEQGGKTPLPGR